MTNYTTPINTGSGGGGGGTVIHDGTVPPALSLLIANPDGSYTVRGLVAGDGISITLTEDGQLMISLASSGEQIVLDLVASEDLAANTLVNIFIDSGTWKFRKADASTSRFASCFVKEAYTTGATARGYFSALAGSQTFTTPGVAYLGEDGAIVDGAAVPSAGIVQQIGIVGGPDQAYIDLPGTIVYL